MSATNPSDSDGTAAVEADDGDEYYAHVNIADDEVIIYNPDATDEWIQSTDAVAIDESA
jgi:hypothetical protein